MSDWSETQIVGFLMHRLKFDKFCIAEIISADFVMLLFISMETTP